MPMILIWLPGISMSLLLPIQGFFNRSGSERWALLISLSLSDSKSIGLILNVVYAYAQPVFEDRRLALKSFNFASILKNELYKDVQSMQPFVDRLKHEWAQCHVGSKNSDVSATKRVT